MRLVFDTNVFISALINPEGKPGILLRKVFNSQKYTIVLSAAIIEELRNTLLYPKVQKYLSFSHKEIEIWISSLMVISHIVEPRFPYPILVPEDPKDDCYIIAALEGKAKYLISGDAHLLRLHPYKNIKIITVSSFLESLDKAL